MAVGTPTKLDTQVLGSGQTITSLSVLPVAKSLLVLHICGRDVAAPNDPTVSDTSGLTWTTLQSGAFNATNRMAIKYATVGGAPVSLQVSADFGAVIAGSSFGLLNVPLALLAAPFLAGTTAGTTGTSTTPNVGTVPAITAGNVQILWAAERGPNMAPKNANWTELYDVNSPTGNCNVAAYYNTLGDTTPSCTITSSPWRAAAAEISAALSGEGPLNFFSRDI